MVRQCLLWYCNHMLLEADLLMRFQFVVWFVVLLLQYYYCLAKFKCTSAPFASPLCIALIVLFNSTFAISEEDYKAYFLESRFNCTSAPLLSPLRKSCIALLTRSSAVTIVNILLEIFISRVPLLKSIANVLACGSFVFS